MPPSHCPNGHPLLPGHVTVGWLPCGQHHGHRTRTCECGATLYDPPTDDTCRRMQLDGFGNAAQSTP